MKNYRSSAYGRGMLEGLNDTHVMLVFQIYEELECNRHKEKAPAAQARASQKPVRLAGLWNLVTG